MDILQQYRCLESMDINRYILEKRQEDLHLDFKTLSSSDDFGREDRKNLSISISVFSNSSGGMIIWGIDARKDPATGIDCAVGIKAISNIKLVYSRLLSYTGQAINPINDGVEHRIILLPEHGVDVGVIASYVPASDSGPHMAKLSEDRYYKRSGDSFYKMEHYDLEDMFGRRKRALLKLSINRLPSTMSNGRKVESFQFNIINEGRNIARYYGMFLSINDIKIEGVVGMNDLSALNQGRSMVGFDDNVGVIHPNGIATRVGIINFVRVSTGSPILITGKLYCQDTRMVELSFHLPPEIESVSM